MYNNGSLFYPSFHMFNPKLLRNGKQLYKLKKIFLITKDNQPLKDKNPVCFFYFLLKLNEYRQITQFPQAEDTDILIDSIQSLISNLTNVYSLQSTNEYKINLYTDKYRIIDTNNVLLNYKGNVIFAKVIQHNEVGCSKPLAKYDNKPICNAKFSSQLSNNQIIKNSLIKFRLDLTKSSLRSISQGKLSFRFYPIQDKKIQTPSFLNQSINYFKNDFSSIDRSEYSKISNDLEFKTPKASKLSSHYFSFKKLPIRKTLFEKSKCVFNSSLYPILQESPISKDLGNQSLSQRPLKFTRQFKNIQKYFNLKRVSDSMLINQKSIRYPLYDNIKQEYSGLIYELRDYIAVYLNDSIKQSSLSFYSLPSNFIFLKQYPKFSFLQCKREFVFYSYLSHQFDSHHPGLLIEFIEKNEVKPSDILSYIQEFKTLIRELIDKPMLILHFFIEKKEIKLSSVFFQLFVLCHDYFNKTQASLSEILMMVLGVNRDNQISEMNFDQFCNYYLHFHQSLLLSKDSQFLFIKKIITFLFNKHSNTLSKDIPNQQDPSILPEKDPNGEISTHEIKEITSKEIPPEVNGNIFESFRAMFELSNQLLNIFLHQYNYENNVLIQRKQTKIDTIYNKIISYFNK